MGNEGQKNHKMICSTLFFPLNMKRFRISRRNDCDGIHSEQFIALCNSFFIILNFLKLLFFNFIFFHFLFDFLIAGNISITNHRVWVTGLYYCYYYYTTTTTTFFNLYFHFFIFFIFFHFFPILIFYISFLFPCLFLIIFYLFVLCRLFYFRLPVLAIRTAYGAWLSWLGETRFARLGTELSDLIEFVRHHAAVNLEAWS